MDGGGGGGGVGLAGGTIKTTNGLMLLYSTTKIAT